MPRLSAVGISGLQAGEDVKDAFSSESGHYKDTRITSISSDNEITQAEIKNIVINVVIFVVGYLLIAILFSFLPKTDNGSLPIIAGALGGILGGALASKIVNNHYFSIAGLISGLCFGLYFGPLFWNMFIVSVSAIGGMFAEGAVSVLLKSRSNNGTN
jgi:hypothetical protein